MSQQRSAVPLAPQTSRYADERPLKSGTKPGELTSTRHCQSKCKAPGGQIMTKSLASSKSMADIYSKCSKFSFRRRSRSTNICRWWRRIHAEGSRGFRSSRDPFPSRRRCRTPRIRPSRRNARHSGSACRGSKSSAVSMASQPRAPGKVTITDAVARYRVSRVGAQVDVYELLGCRS